jgi:hypothetical protein
LVWLHLPGHSLAVEAADAEVAASTGAEAVFTAVDLAFAKAAFAEAEYPYYGSDYEGGCYLIARRIPTRDGWRTRRVEVCD